MVDNNVAGKKTSPNAIDILTWKMNNDQQYGERIITDYDYAKTEFSKSGIEIDKESHSQLKEAFAMLNNATNNIFRSQIKPNLTVIFAT
jgi:hypothetical protein